jgi:hypothetical protein
MNCAFNKYRLIHCGVFGKRDLLRKRDGLLAEDVIDHNRLLEN